MSVFCDVFTRRRLDGQGSTATDLPVVCLIDRKFDSDSRHHLTRPYRHAVTFYLGISSCTRCRGQSCHRVCTLDWLSVAVQ